MRKVLLFLSLALMSLTSYSEWKLVTTNLEKGVMFQVNTETIKSRNGYVYFWELWNFLKPEALPNGETVFSIKSFYQTDCDLLRTKTLSVSTFEKYGGKGKSTSIDTNDEWTYHSPGSVGGRTAKYACDYIK